MAACAWVCCQAVAGGMRTWREPVIPFRWLLFLWGVPVPLCHSLGDLVPPAHALVSTMMLLLLWTWDQE